MNDFSKKLIQKDHAADAVRINKYLSDAGICSRREADQLIEKGLITVDGRPAEKGQRIDPGRIVEYKGKPVNKENRMIILAYNKPVGVECTTAPDVPDNIISRINYPSRIFPIGRLDKNSSGLILLTNTGELSDKILRGSNFHEKEYEVTVDRKISSSFLKQMSQGVRIFPEDAKEPVLTRPCRIRKAGERSFNIILTQGLNRQIRRMCTQLGYKVISLNRIRIMNIVLGNLKTGKYRNLTENEIRSLINSL